MPQDIGNVPPFRPQKDLQVLVDSFNGGWNNFSRPTELKDNELAQADNLMLTGKGIPTQRWGSTYYNLVGSGRIRMLNAYKNTTNATNQLLSISDSGYLVKKNSASYTMITGASFASGLSYQSVQLGNNLYISAATLPFTKYNGSNLVPYLQLVTPSLASMAILSATSGLELYSWRITALSATGETLGSPARNFASLPLDLTGTAIQLNWLTVSAASGQLLGYNIYRGTPGNERYLTSVNPTVTTYIDDGSIVPSTTISAPFSDTTAGIRAKYIIKWDDRVVLAGVADEPSKVYISARYPFQDRFTAIDGGGYGYCSPDDGDEITGLGVAGNQGMSTTASGPPPSSLIIFKRNSTHRLSLQYANFGNYVVLDPSIQTLTSSNGCSSGDTVVPVENDTFYFGRKGLFTIGQEPTFLNQIRTNELSSRIRTYLSTLSEEDYNEATAGYINNKYLLSFPSKKETIIYDRERLAFMGPWKTPFGISKWYDYIDPNGAEAYIAGTDLGANYEFSPSYVSDNGTAISKILRTKKFDFGAWSVMKTLRYFYVLFRNVRGQVNVNILIETRTGSTVVTKNFTLSSSEGTSGWGSDEYGTVEWGDSVSDISLTGEELARYGNLFKQARVVQVEVTADVQNSSFEFLGLRLTGTGLGDSSLPSSDRV